MLVADVLVCLLTFPIKDIKQQQKRSWQQKAVSWKGIWWGKGQKRFHSPCSWPLQSCLEIRLCWNSAPGSPSPKRLIANCNTKAGVPIPAVLLWGVTLRCKIGLSWAEYACLFQCFPFSGAKSIFLPISLPDCNQKPSRGLHSFSRDPPAQPLWWVPASLPRTSTLHTGSTPETQIE